MNNTFSVAKGRATRLVTITLLIGAASLYADPYSVDTIGDWTDTVTNPPGALANALQQSDIATNGIQLTTDLNNATWTNWAVGSTGGIILAPITLSETLNFDLNGFTLAGQDFSFASDTGILAFANGTLGSSANKLSFGVDGNSTVTFTNATLNASAISIVSDDTHISDLTFANSTINLASGGTFTMDGQGKAPTGYPVNGSGQPIDGSGNVVTEDYYYRSVLLDNTSLHGVDTLIITNGAGLQLANNAFIDAKDISVTGARQDYSSTLKGNGTLSWAGVFSATTGAVVDLSKIAVNGDPAGSLTVGKNTTQSLTVSGGKISTEPGSIGEFIPTQFTLAGALTFDNASTGLISDSAQVNGVTNLSLLNSSKLKLTGQLSFNHELATYVGPTLAASGNLEVSGGSILALENAWQINVGGTTAIDNGTVYVGVDLSKAPSEDYGQGILERIPTQLTLTGPLLIGETSTSGSQLIIQGGAQVLAKNNVLLGAGTGTNALVSLDQNFTSTGAPASSGSAFRVTGNLIVGGSGNAVVNVGDTLTNPSTSVSTGSTWLASGAGSTATVTINARPPAENLQYFYNPSNSAWYVTGAGETNRSNLVSQGNASLTVGSGLVYIDQNGVFSMGGQNGTTAGYIAGTSGAYGVAVFDSGNSELRLSQGSFVNAGAGSSNEVGKVIFSNGAVLSGSGSIYAGESIQFKSAVLAPGSRFLYDDRDDTSPIENPPVIGHLDLYLNKAGSNVLIDSGSRLKVAFDNPSAIGGTSSDVTVHNGNANLSEGFVVDMYRIFEGSYKLLSTPDGTIGGTYTGYSLQGGYASYFALNGSRLEVNDNGTILRSNRILQGTGDIVTYFTPDKKELWISLSHLATTGNVHTYWTGAASNIWSMYAENWDTTTTNGTKQFLSGDVVSFQDGTGVTNRDIVLKTYDGNSSITTVGVYVEGSSNWSFSGAGMRVYNSELYTTLKLDDSNVLLRPTGRLIKAGSGTLTINNSNEFFGGIHLGDHVGSTGGTVILNNETGFGTYDVSSVVRGVNKGTVFTHNDATLQTTASVQKIQNRFVIDDGITLQMVIANPTLTVSGDRSYGLSNEQGAGGGAFYIEGTVNANNGLVLSGNQAIGGGSLYLSGNGDLIAPSLVVQNSLNSSATSGGGGIYSATGGAHTLKNLTLTGNDSYGVGGGLYVRGSDTGQAGTLTLSGNTTITGNRATGDGGGVYLEGGENNGQGIGHLALSTSAGESIVFSSNFSGVNYNNDSGTGSLNPSDIKTDDATSNAVFISGYGDLTAIGNGTVYFYDPISSGFNQTAFVIGTGASDTVTVVMHGLSPFSGTMTVGGTATLRLENGNTSIRGTEIQNGMAGLGVMAPLLNGAPYPDLTAWTVFGETFNLKAGAQFTGNGVIGARNGIKLDGILNLDEGGIYNPSPPFATKTIGTLNLLGNVTLANSAVWNVTLAKGTASPAQIRSADNVNVLGAASFTSATATNNLTVNIDDLIRGKYQLMSTTDGISNFNTDQKKSGAVVLWNYGSGTVDLTRTGLDGTADSHYGRAFATTYVEGKNLYLNLAARNRSVLASGSTGIWSDNGLWEFNPSTLLPSGGTLSFNWTQNDTGPATNTFINGDRVTFAPTAGNATYQIQGTVRPVDLIVSGTSNTILAGTGGIQTYSPTLAADIAATTINPTGSTATNDYGIALYTGSLVKNTASTLTLQNGTNTFAGGIIIGDSATGSTGGTVEFSNGNQLGVGSGKNIHFVGDGILRNTSASTTLATAINIDSTKIATFDVDDGRTLIQSGQISGAGAVTKTSDGILALAATNTFTGGATLTAGTVQVRANNALGAAYTGTGSTGLVSVIGAGTLTNANGAHTLNNHFAVTTGGALTITTSSNALTLSSVNVNALNGGAISVDAGAANQLFIDGNGSLQISGNKAANGGAIYTAHTDDLHLGGGTSFHLTLTNNQATAGSGGAINSAGNILATIGGQLTITNNTASANGGAIYAQDAAVFLVNSGSATSTITGNKATGNGGAIYAQTVSLTNNGTATTTISGNTATGNGGAYYIDSGVLALDAASGNIQISGNTAALGSAAYINGIGGAVSILGNKDVYFYDTLVSDTADLHSFVKGGTGTLMFANEGSENNNNAFFGNAAILAGNIRVTQGTTFGVNAVGSSFDLNAGAYLTGGGTISAANSTIAGVVSADINTGLQVENSTHTFFNIGNLTFNGNLKLENGSRVIVDMGSNPSGDLNGVGTADQIHVTGILDPTSQSDIDLYSFNFGQYLILTAGSTINMTAGQIASNFTFTIHDEALTDRHTIHMYRGDDSNITASGANDTQLWLRTVRNSLYMNWSGAKSGNWNPYDPNNLNNENWVNNNIGSGRIAEGHVRNADTVYFGDTAYNYTASNYSGPAVTTSTINILKSTDAAAPAAEKAGVIVTDMTVNNTSVNYTFTGGAISTIGTYEGTILTGTPGQNLTKQGTGTLTFSNTANTFAGQLLMSGGTITFTSSNGANSFGFLNLTSGIINLQNSANTFTGGINFQGVSGDSRLINYSTAAQLSTAAVTFAQSGTLHAQASVQHTNTVSIQSGAIATLQSDAGKLTSFVGASNISGAGGLTKTGTGILQIASTGSNQVGGQTSITAGTFRVTQGASYGNSSSGSFSLASGTTLGGGGTIGASSITLNGIITPDSVTLTPGSLTVPAASYGTLALNSSSGTVTLQGITYQYDMGTAATSPTGSTATGDLIKITGANTVTLNGTNALNLTSGNLVYGNYYLLVDSNATITSDGTNPVAPASAFANITYNGSSIEPRIGKHVTFGTNPDSSVNNKQLWLSVSRNTLDMTWNTGSGTWDTTAADWSSTQQSGGVHSKIFNNGDYVHFTDSSGTAAKIVTLSSNTIVSGLVVNSTGNYTFSGSGGIQGINTNPSGQDYITGEYVGSSIIPDGILQKNGSGTLTVSNGANSFTKLLVQGGTLAFTNAQNTFAGGITLAGGTTSITNANQITVGAGTGIGFIGNATLSSAGTTTLAHQIDITGGQTATFNTSAASDVLTLSGLIEDAPSTTGGILAKNGAGTVLLTSASTYSGGTLVNGGTLEITGQAASAGVAGSTVTIFNGGSFYVGEQSAPTYTLENRIVDGVAGTNTGILVIDSGNNFEFGPATNGTSFSGDVRMRKAIYNVDSVAEAFFSGGATLTTMANSSGTVADNLSASERAWDFSQSSIVLDGGSLTWNFDGANDATGIIAAKNISTGRISGTNLNIMLQAGINTPNPVIDDGTSLFAFQVPPSGTTLLLATTQGDPATIATGQLHTNLYIAGVPQSDTGSIQTITTLGSINLADAVFDWGAYVASGSGSTHELRIGYVLKELRVYEDQDLFVVRTASDGKVFGVKITDKTTNGNVYFADQSTAHDGIILTSQNTYTGHTYVQNNTALTLGVDNALGNATTHTSYLILQGTGSSVSLGDTTQYVGSLGILMNGTQHGVLDMGTGTLNLSNGVVEGDNALIGGGTINIGGNGVLGVSGSNAGLTTTINISDTGAALISKTDGLGTTGDIANAGTLDFSGAVGNFSKNLSQDGTVIAVADSDTGAISQVVLTGDNHAFSGAFAILDGSTLTASTAENIGTASVFIDEGTFIADNSSDWTLDPANKIMGGGTLQKQNSGTLTIGHANLPDTSSNPGFFGTTNIIGGTLQLTVDGALGDATQSTNIVTLGSAGTLELATGVTGFANKINGTGVTLVSGTNNGSGIDITGDNSGFAATGQWHITGTANITQQNHLGSAAVNLDGTGSQLNLTTASAGSFDFVNSLSGNGVLSTKLTGNTDQFTLNTSAGTAFTGTLQLQDSFFELGGTTQGNTNAAALAQATLQTSAGNTTRVNGNATIGALTIDGGFLCFDVDLPPDNIAAGVLTASNGINITTNAGKVGINNDLTSSSSASFINPVAPTQRNILDQDNIDSDAVRLASGTVSGNVGSLLLVDKNGNAVTNGQQVDIQEGGTLAAVGTYDYGLASGTGNDGLYVGYILKVLDLKNTGDGALTLSNSGSADNTLNAQITGAGNLAIEANGGQIVLSNASNDYTGQTTVKNGTLVSGVDNALGSTTSHTSKLTVNGGATFDLGNHIQTIDALDNQGGATVTLGSGTLTLNGILTSANGTLNLGTGTLKVNAGGSITGNNSLLGDAASTLHVDPSVLTVSGSNVNYHGTTLIDGGSTVILDHTYGLGDGTISIQAATDNLTLNISDAANAGAAQAIKNTLQGAGVLQVNTAPSATVYITKANSGLTGTTLVEHGNLTITNLQGVGTSAINVANTDSVYTWQGVTGVIANAMSGAGTIVFDDSEASIDHATTAGAYQLNHGTQFVLLHANGLGTNQASVNIDQTSSLLLSISNPVLGRTTNQGLISFASPSASTGPFNQATLTSLDGTGNLLFNVNFETSKADHLTIIDSAQGSQTVMINRVGGIPASGDGIIPIIKTQNSVSAAGTFKLPKGSDGKEVYDVGSFAYTLRKGNGNDKTPSPNDWYLVGDSPSKMAEVIIGTAATMGMSWQLEMDNLLKRMGDLRVSQTQGYGNENKQGIDTWVRSYGWEMDANKRVSGSSFTEYNYGVDAGADKTFRIENDLSSGFLYTGVFIGGGRSNRQFNGYGKGDSDLYHGGFYISYLDDKGWYADLVAKGNYYDNNFESISTYGDKAHGDYDQWGAGVSLEVGRQLISEKGWFWEPQVQASYGYIDGTSYTTTGDFPVGVTIHNQNTFQLRGGVRFGKHLDSEYGTFSPYAKASAAGMWTDGGRVTTSDGMSARATLDGARMELGAGVTWETNQWGQIYFDYEYIQAQKFIIPWKVNLGYRIQW